MAAGTERHQEMLDAVATLLHQAKSALFITGAALSADSDLPIYRGLPGLDRRSKEEGKLFEAALSIETLHDRPKTTWKLLLDMDARVRAAQPNAGHAALVRFEQALDRCAIMTVNVDRLHQRAGSKNVIEMHGALHSLLCSRCEISTHHDRFDRLAIPPTCPACGSVLRPDMPLFGEQLPADPFTRLQAELDQGFDLVIAAGVTTVFPYLARPLLVARSEGIPTIEIGSQNTDISDIVDFRFKGSPMRVLDLIADAHQISGRSSRPRL